MFGGEACGVASTARTRCVKAHWATVTSGALRTHGDTETQQERNINALITAVLARKYLFGHESKTVLH